jgi:hypothetical protein
MVRVTPDGGLHAGSGGASFGLRPVGIGRTRLTPTRPGVVRVSAAGARDDLAAVSVWYRSGRWGLEQGFTVAHRPAGSGALRIVMRTGGTMIARLSGAGAVSAAARASAARCTSIASRLRDYCPLVSIGSQNDTLVPELPGVMLDVTSNSPPARWMRSSADCRPRWSGRWLAPIV